MTNRIITFSIVTYNNEKQINKLFDNLLRILRGKGNITIYVVDNGSRDKTLEICKEYAKYLNIKIIRNQHNIGFGKAHNRVLPLINSDYHIVINPDITIPDFKEIEKMVEYMDKNQNIGLLSPLILNEDGTIQKLYKLSPTVFDLGIRFLSPNMFKKRQQKFVRESSGYNEIGHIDYASGCFMLFRTNTLKRIKGFDERYFMYMEDADITREINQISEAVFFPNAKVKHAWQRQSHKKIKMIFISLMSTFKYFKKWGWIFY